MSNEILLLSGPNLDYWVRAIRDLRDDHAGRARRALYEARE